MSRFNFKAYDQLYPRQTEPVMMPVQSAVEGFKKEDHPVDPPEQEPEPKKDIISTDPIPEQPPEVSDAPGEEIPDGV